MSETSHHHHGRSLPLSRFRYGVLGPAIILLAFGQATGELIQWPYLLVKYGTYFVFCLLPACFIQVPIFSFLARHTLVSGETFFSTLLKSWKLYAVFVWFVFLFTTIWIGSYTAAGGLSFAKLISVIFGRPLDLQRWSAIIAIILNTIYFTLLLGSRRTYRLVKVFMDIIAALSFVAIFTLFAVALWTRGRVIEFSQSVVQWKMHLPAAWDSADAKILLSAIIFAGLGGLWNALYSSWVRNEQMGMAAFNTDEYVDYQARLPEVAGDSETVRNLRSNMRRIHWDLLVGIGVNFIMLLMLAYLAYVYFPAGRRPPTGMGIATVLADSVGAAGIWVAVLAYVFVALLLVDTWLTAADSLSKTHANFVTGWLGSKGTDVRTTSRLRYLAALIALWLMTIVSSFAAQPQQWIFLNGVLSALGSILLIVGIIANEMLMRRVNAWLHPPRVMWLFLILALIVYIALAVAYVTAPS